MSIDADLARLREARQWAERAAEEFGFGADHCYQVKLAMSEAVANAIEHGSTSAGDIIRLRVVHEGDALAFYVSDGGTFIEPDMVRPITHLEERGRGIGFIELLMDDISIAPSPDGTVLRFAKRLSS